MLGIAHRPSTRIVSSRHSMARVALVVMLAALFGAASAQADEGTPAEPVAVAQESESAGSETPPEAQGGETPGASGTETPAEGQVTETPGGSGTEGQGTETPGGSGSEGQGTETPGGSGAEGQGTETPAAEAPREEAGGPERSEQPQPNSEAPPESVPPPATQESVSATPPAAAEAPSEAPLAPVAELPTEPAPSERPTSESSSSEAPLHAKGDERAGIALATLPGAVPATAGSAASSEAAVAASATPTGSMVIDLGAAPVAGESSSGGHRRAASGPEGPVDGGGRCDLQGLGGAGAGGCVGAWMTATGPLSPDAVSMPAPPTAVLAGTGVAGPAGGGGEQPGAAGGGRSMPPAPSPAPGGASGVAAGGGAAGVGLAGFLTFALLLALAAPHATRRLKLACLPWRTAFFVLIPERPG